MDKLLIRGGRTLQGEVLISGAKNAALPELCATLLTADPVTLRNVPRLQDVSTMLTLIRNMGVQVDQQADMQWPGYWDVMPIRSYPSRPVSSWSNSLLRSL